MFGKSEENERGRRIITKTKSEKERKERGILIYLGKDRKTFGFFNFVFDNFGFWSFVLSF